LLLPLHDGVWMVLIYMHILTPDAMPCFAQGGDSGGQYMSASGERLNTKDILALKDENVDDAVWVPGVCLDPHAPNPHSSSIWA